MNAPKRTSAKAIGMAVNLVLLIPLLTGCNPQKAAKDNHAEPAASEIAPIGSDRALDAVRLRAAIEGLPPDLRAMLEHVTENASQLRAARPVRRSFPQRASVA